ncbi:conjugative transposon protein TraK [Tenacibaculum ovolyticum]|uniref:conjugative transposon protein TraK n=1 Tax=Tenacibaculum ovolyticum TaxID=104270 RepID=UPI0007ECA9C9|nr:conjugative transposon protein TraK [Tenacibaculum ovolyticum]
MENLKNIDSAFKLTKKITFSTIILCFVFCAITMIYSLSLIKKEKEKIYVLVNNKALEIALLQDVDSNRKAEVKNHSKIFHSNFFGLDPDTEMINENINYALILADNSVRQIHSRRNEKLYYHNLIQGGISTEIKPDSIKVDISEYPYRAVYYGKQRIIRPSNITLKKFVAAYKLRNTKRTDNNSHGLYIEDYKILNHETINSYGRE